MIVSVSVSKEKVKLRRWQRAVRARVTLCLVLVARRLQVGGRRQTTTPSPQAAIAISSKSLPCRGRVQEFSLCLWIKVSLSHQPPEQEMPQQQVPLNMLTPVHILPLC